MQANICLFLLHTVSSRVLCPATSAMKQMIISAHDRGKAPRRAFKDTGTSSSVSPCLTPQTTVLYHQVNHRSTLGRTDSPNLIFLISPCLPSSYSKIWILPRVHFFSLWSCERFIFYSLSSPPCGFTFLQSHYCLCACCQPLSKIMMITFEELMGFFSMSCPAFIVC